jgi:vanillate O-demethylase ferredoxin subunit
MKNDLPANAVAAGDVGAQTLTLRVRQVRFEGVGIHSYELVDPAGGDLPPFEAGAHLDVHLPDGVLRQYSISSDPAQRHHYVIGVLRDDQGRGGSRAVHETLHVQDIVRTSLPRNNFRLRDGARKVILLAGGIGVTPLKSMAHALDRAGVDFELHYCAKDATFAAFGDELRALAGQGRVHYHFDGGVPGRGLDLAALLRSPLADTHVYYCGPSGFMRACADAAAAWPAGAVHFEHFKPPVDAKTASGDGDSPANADEGRFTIRIHSTGASVEVGPDQSIVEALGAAGVHVETSCASGLCGTCKVRYLCGSVDHKDYILSDEEHAEYLTACVSRATSPVLELDL